MSSGKAYGMNIAAIFKGEHIGISGNAGNHIGTVVFAAAPDGQIGHIGNPQFGTVIAIVPIIIRPIRLAVSRCFAQINQLRVQKNLGIGSNGCQEFIRSGNRDLVLFFGNHRRDFDHKVRASFGRRFGGFGFRNRFCGNGCFRRCRNGFRSGFHSGGFLCRIGSTAGNQR